MLTALNSASAMEANRGWENSFAPTSPPVGKTLHVFDVEKRSGSERIAACCLQGLVARKQPSIWLKRAPRDDFWLDHYRQKGDIETLEEVDSLEALFALYPNRAKGALIADTDLYRGELLAITAAACEDLIVATPEIAKRLKLPVKIDLRNRFKTYAEGLQWLTATYSKKLNPFLCDFRSTKLVPFATFDQTYQWRAHAFWLTGPKDKNKRGVDAKSELSLIKNFLSNQAAGGVCIGFPHGGEHVGIGEPQGVELLSRYAISLIVTDHRSNYSWRSGLRVEKFGPPKQIPAPKLDRSKIYVALNLSDGDNQILWPHYFRRYFEHPAFGTFPLAFGVGPTITEFQPRIAQWHFINAAANTEFICDVSGAGYINPNVYGKDRKNPDTDWQYFLYWTKRLMKRADLKSIRTVTGNDQAIRRYVAALPECHSIFADMGRYSGHSGIKNLTYQLDDMPIFRSVTSWRYGKDGFLKEIHEQVGDTRPAFVNGFVHCWTFGMDELVKIHKQAGDEVVFVTPSQLADLYRASLK